MTEVEWARCQSPDQLIAFLKGKVSDRKMRLFACACCRRVWHLLGDACREAVELAEGFADSTASREALSRSETRAYAEANEPRVFNVGTTRVASLAAWCATRASSHSIETRSSADYASLAFALEGGANEARAQKREKGIQCNLIREVIGDSFNPVTLAPAWLTPDVVTLAQTAYAERLLPSGTLDAARLAVLADALEEAGCTDTAIHSHLRSVGPHVRGCWALDLVLGKQ